MGQVSGHFIYIIRCIDGSLYTGYTVDVERRVKEHNHSKRGAKYTRGRLPVILEYCEAFDRRSDATKREYEIKRMSKEEKEKLVG